MPDGPKFAIHQRASPELQFTAVQERSRGTGNGRWSSLNRLGRPRSELLMRLGSRRFRGRPQMGHKPRTLTATGGQARTLNPTGQEERCTWQPISCTPDLPSWDCHRRDDETSVMGRTLASRSRHREGRCAMPVFAVMTAKGPNWDTSRGNREQQAWDEHAAFFDDLVDRGVVILGGPRRPGPGQQISRGAPAIGG